MAIISRFRAVAMVGKLRLTGVIAWLMWLAVHLVYITGFKNRITAVLHWFVSFLGRGRSERTTTEQQIFARSAMARLTRGATDLVSEPVGGARGPGSRRGAPHRRRRARREGRRALTLATQAQAVGTQYLRLPTRMSSSTPPAFSITSREPRLSSSQVSSTRSSPRWAARGSARASARDACPARRREGRTEQPMCPPSCSRW